MRATVRSFVSSAGRSASTPLSTDTPGEGTRSRAGSQSAEAMIILNVNGTALGVASNNSATIEQLGLG